MAEQPDSEVEEFLSRETRKPDLHKRLKKGLYELLHGSTDPYTGSSKTINLDGPKYKDAYLKDDGAELVAKLLKRNVTCKALSLKNNKISDVGAQALGDALNENITLQKLNLTNNDISDIGAQALGNALKQNDILTTLVLSGNDIDVAGAKAIGNGLAENNSLIELDLSRNKFRDEGVEAIANGLERNTKLIKINFESNSLTDEGAETLADLLITNLTLETLKVTDPPFSFDKKNKISTCGLMTLANACKLRGKRINLGVLDAEMRAPQLRADTKIGGGNYGSAYRGKYGRSMDRDCVIKVASSKTSPECFYETILLNSLPPHENVLRLVGICDSLQLEEDHHQVLVVAFHGGGSLKNYVVNKKGDTDVARLFSYALQMTRALEHIQKFNMVHRDIALRNFVLSEDFKKVILIDFGLSYIITVNAGTRNVELSSDDLKNCGDDSNIQSPEKQKGTYVGRRVLLNWTHNPATLMSQKGICLTLYIPDESVQCFGILDTYVDSGKNKGKYKIAYEEGTISRSISSDERPQFYDPETGDFGGFYTDVIAKFLPDVKTHAFYARDNEQLPMKRLAPESLCSPYPFFLSSDCWMLGVAFWELLSGANPFHFTGNFDQHRLFLFHKMISNGEQVPLVFPPKTPPEMRELIEYCCEFDFLKRPGPANIIAKIQDITSRGLQNVSNLKEKMGSRDGNLSDGFPQSDYGGIEDLSSASYVGVGDIEAGEAEKNADDLSAPAEYTEVHSLSFSPLKFNYVEVGGGVGEDMADGFNEPTDYTELDSSDESTLELSYVCVVEDDDVVKDINEPVEYTELEADPYYSYGGVKSTDGGYVELDEAEDRGEVDNFPQMLQIYYEQTHGQNCWV